MCFSRKKFYTATRKALRIAEFRKTTQEQVEANIMKPFVDDISEIDIKDAFLAIKHLPYSLLLDSADQNHQSSRYSFAMCMPIETIEVKNGKIDVTNWEQRLTFSGDPLALLQARMKSWVERTETLPNLPPFQGGAAGLFGYDLGRYIEKLPTHAKDSSTTPDMAIGIYDQVIARDHLLKKTYIFTHAKSQEEADKKRHHLLGLISQNYEKPEYQPVNLDWHANFSQEDYEDQVQRVRDYITAGDIFQANISQQFSSKLPNGFDPYIHYLHLREENPAPFAAYMNLGNIKISSASPERFLTVKNGNVETCPIKGTRPRAEKPADDRANKNDLINSEKDNAENTMIVDLLRNDLSKVCTPESVDVTDLCKIESFKSVHHLVSTIKGKLKTDKTALDLLRSCFPGGSITGAPKIRAMEIIEEIEPTRRGAYCGAIGYLGFDGNMDTNILIRTLTFEGNHVTLNAGGGIIADSNPTAEYQETLDKARALLLSFETKKNPEFKKAG